uniref:Uncharacterized protein n=1 Tax=Anguilla anguilla TaxID=7936 RepID=A0A0E9VR38_ANGAN
MCYYRLSNHHVLCHWFCKNMGFFRSSVTVFLNNLCGIITFILLIYVDIITAITRCFTLIKYVQSGDASANTTENALKKVK